MPKVLRFFVRLAGAVVPQSKRAVWRDGQLSNLESWWILSERGEIAGTRAELCRVLLLHALRQRCTYDELVRAMRGPVLPLAGIATVAVVMALTTQFFSVTRTLLAIAFDPSGAQMGRLVANLSPVVFAAVTSAVLMFTMRRSVRMGGWRHGLFFGAKTAGMLVTATLFWFEAGGRLRAGIPHEPGFRLFIFGIVFGLAYILAMGYLTAWNFADQRSRCPMCLRRMALPVSMGSWASVFDPPSTELVCEDGHGTLSVAECDISPPDKWVALDTSWSSLFHTATRG
jgi:hypothetical protein